MLLKGEEKYAKHDRQRNPLSQKLCTAGVNLSYWKKIKCPKTNTSVGTFLNHYLLERILLQRTTPTQILKQ